MSRTNRAGSVRNQAVESPLNVHIYVRVNVQEDVRAGSVGGTSEGAVPPLNVR